MRLIVPLSLWRQTQWRIARFGICAIGLMLSLSTDRRPCGMRWSAQRGSLPRFLPMRRKRNYW